MSHFETEGRFFASEAEMIIDRKLFNMEGGVYSEKDNTWTSLAGVRKVQWIVVRDRKDAYKVGGINFEKVMFDVMVDRESIMYLLTRLRGVNR